MTTHDPHETVQRAYTEALRRSRGEGGGCCPGPASTTAAAAGYGDDAASHADVAQSSFGCGNPLAFVEVRPGETVLDLGAGAGLDLLIAAERVGSRGRVIGIDMTDAMIETARRNTAGHPQVEVRKGLIEALPVDDASVDWVISNCVINLSPDKPRVFSEIARVLRPGGRFSISDIVAESLPSALRESDAAYAACIAGAISEADYLAGLRAAGLVDVQVADRLVYDADQLRGVVGSDLANLGLAPSMLDPHLEQVTGKVWSAKVMGRKAG